MKKIIIVNNNMHIGGVQKALLNLLCAIKDKYDISLLLFNPAGEYMSEIPENIKIIKPNSDYCYLGMTKFDVKGNIAKFIKRSFYAMISRLFGRNFAIKLMSFGQKKLKEYDIAISYLQNSTDKGFYGGCNDFVLNCIDANKKVTFLHCDFEKCGANTEINKKQYANFDVIAACSQGCGDAFKRVVPKLKDKVVTVNNCHNFEEIKELAQISTVTMDDSKLKVLTVARLGTEKGVARAVEAISDLGNLKEELKYYIVGNGSQYNNIKEIIRDKGLEETVIMCGASNNPYPYIRNADLLLIPSYNEAAPLVIGEAVALGVPVLSTKTSSAVDMIQNTGYGWVCENSIEGITCNLKKLLCNKQQIFQKKKHLLKIDINNDVSVNQFDMMINN